MPALSQLQPEAFRPVSAQLHPQWNVLLLGWPRSTGRAVRWGAAKRCAGAGTQPEASGHEWGPHALLFLSREEALLYSKQGECVTGNQYVEFSGWEMRSNWWLNNTVVEAIKCWSIYLSPFWRKARLKSLNFTAPAISCDTWRYFWALVNLELGERQRLIR